MSAVDKKDCQHALQLLEEYYEKLDSVHDEELMKALEKVIKVFKSQLFGALIDIQEYYEEILRDVHQSPEQVNREARILAQKWDRMSPNGI